MSNTLYPSARSSFCKGEIDWEDGGTDFTVYLLDSSYTYDSGDEFVSAISGSILGTPQVLTGNTVLDDGICDSDDLNYPGVSIGETVVAIVIAIDTGSTATSPLIYFADTNNDTTPINRAGDGSVIPLVWAASTNRVFKI